MMSGSLNSYLNKKVLCLLTDGRTLVGTLISCDNVTNLVLEGCIERIIRPNDDEEPSSEEPVGCFVIRGEQVVVCGLVEEELDNQIDWAKVRGELIGGTKHV